jgi:predicted dehydrogenase
MSPSASAPPRTRPRLGFLGLGWIGWHRMDAIARSGLADIACLADPSAEAIAHARTTSAPDAEAVTPEMVAESDIDGLVIATPSALHADQAIAALERGIPVFCQKPLGRNALEVERAVTAAREAGVLLEVDMSYRWCRAIDAVRRTIHGGEIGSVFSADLVFHNAYGPDKSWFYQPELSGGGCVIDLGTHLVDLVHWILPDASVTRVSAQLFSRGQRWSGRDQTEDYATATLELSSGATARIACSWNLAAGKDAVIQGFFAGREGSVAFHNVNGSFFDLVAERYRGTSRETLEVPPDEWGGRAAVAWARRVSNGDGFDPVADHLVATARTIDMIYAAGSVLPPEQP